MRERHADARHQKRPEARHPRHDEVADGKQKEQEQKELAALELGREHGQGQRHHRHDKGVARENEARKGHRLMKAFGDVRQKPHGQKFRRVEDEGREGEPDDGKPGSQAVFG